MVDLTVRMNSPEISGDRERNVSGPSRHCGLNGAYDPLEWSAA